MTDIAIHDTDTAHQRLRAEARELCDRFGGDQVAPVNTNLILAFLGQHVLGLPRSY
jgi:hypothetical protein